MRLEFEGYEILEATIGGVNFVGFYPDGPGRTRDVLCRITREALVALCELSSPTPDDLLTAYRSERERIKQLAAAQFFAGFASPHITTSDLPQEWLRASRAA